MLNDNSEDVVGMRYYSTNNDSVVLYWFSVVVCSCQK